MPTTGNKHSAGEKASISVFREGKWVYAVPKPYAPRARPKRRDASPARKNNWAKMLAQKPNC